MIFGAIADDVTGATDLASMLRRAGARVIQTLGEPRIPPPPGDALIVATKARMLAVDEARDVASAAARFLERAGVEQIYLKYCSTFDSTEQGNIGPLTDLLLEREDQAFTLACPAYPALARTVYQGHLFVGDRLLSESSMRDHPLTPMRDPDLVRFLGRQTASPVGLVPLTDVEIGVEAIRRRFDDLAARGIRIAVADAILDRHVDILGKACADMRVATGGAAFGAALVGTKLRRQAAEPHDPPLQPGAACMLSGSCSAATSAQVAFALHHGVPAHRLDPVALATSERHLDEVVNWAIDQARKGAFLIYSTSDPAAVRHTQQDLGRAEAAAMLEHAFGAIARALADAGVRNFVVAGGETSGAVIQALDIRMVTFGAELAPGVPRTYSLDPEGYSLVFKSGNFGAEDFFMRALDVHR